MGHSKKPGLIQSSHIWFNYLFTNHDRISKWHDNIAQKLSGD